MATTLPTGALAPGQTEQVGSKKAVSLIDSLLSTPSLPQGTSITPQAQNVQTNELLATPGVTGTLAAQAGAGTAATATAATAPTATSVGAATPQTASSYTGQVVGTAPTMTAATGSLTQPMTAAQQAIASLDPKATVQGQLESITTDIESSLASGSNLPAFARGAAEAAKATMQARGLGASTMLAEALAEGILKSSVPIAAADAQTYKEVIFQNLANNQQAAVVNAQSYLQMDVANLSNAQQASMQNLHAKQQTLLSDNAARNAALQFNATSQNQVNQFYDSLNTNLQTQNAQRTDAMAQYNNAEANKVAALNAKNATALADANAQRETAISQFNKTLEDARARFNVENQRVIDQSNAVWRRSINTANTASDNASNETNAMNLLNLSNFAMSGLWQQWRDEASWVQTSSQNVNNRDHNMAIAALERTTAFDLQNSAQKAALYGLLGQFGMEVFKDF
jgi:hypothetical protein|tara:strand:+ start:530 stop:1897 length:1368 start_codon:yes stop_codon:yes gene_type:complete